MTARRVAFAAVEDGQLTFGDPGSRHLVMTAATVRCAGQFPDGESGPDDASGSAAGPGAVPWTEIVELTVDAPQSRMRYPIPAVTAIATGVSLIGWEWSPGTAAGFKASCATGLVEGEVVRPGVTTSGHLLPLHE